MQITNFSINITRDAINLTIVDAATVNSLKLFTDKTYKDYNQAIDLTSKLTGSTTENITITLADINSPYFDGVYFIEVEDPDEISQAITEDLTRYEECILNKLLEIGICEDCMKKETPSLVNAFTLLESLKTSIKNGLIDEIFIIVGMLNKYCSNTCKSCGQYNNMVDNNYYSTPPNDTILKEFDLGLSGYDGTGDVVNIYENGILKYNITPDTSYFEITVEIDITKGITLEAIGSLPQILIDGETIASFDGNTAITVPPISFAEPYYSSIVNKGINGNPLIEFINLA